MQDYLPSFTAASLLRRNLWLIRLRWYAVLGVLAGITVAYFLLPQQSYVPVLTGLLVILILSNLVYLYATRISNVFTKTRLVRLLGSQMTVDLIMLTLFIYFSGGIESPLSFFYVFHIILASIIFPGRLPYVYGGLAVILYSTMLTLDALHILPHVCFYPGVHLADSLELVIGTWLIFLTTIFASAYLAKSVTDRHRRVREKLELANRQLKEINRTKTEFFRFSSHEMKSPIITVQSALLVIRDVLGEGIDERVLDMVDRAVKKTDEMIIMLKDLADLTYGNLQERNEFKLLNLCEILGRTVENERPTMEHKNLQLELQMPESDCKYFCDEASMEKVFRNLVSNAVRYTPDGGSIRVILEVMPDSARIIVADTGIGIPKEEHQNVFREFYRTPGARTTVKEGTGLGLAIVQRLVESHGGSIELDSDVGVGTTFTVTLPRVEAA